MKRILYFFIGLAAWISLLCSVAASSVTNENLMKQGFMQYSQTAPMNVPASRYGDYAKAVTQYLDGKTAVAQVQNPESGQMENAFSDKENLHLSDVRGIVNGLKIVRWVGGALALCGLLLLYWKREGEKAGFLSRAVRGFALSALFLLFTATVLSIWGAANFDGLFVTFHKIAFSNDLWLLNPQTDLLMALMPLSFFIWYAGEILKALLPVLGMMLAVIVAWLKIGKTQKETETI